MNKDEYREHSEMQEPEKEKDAAKSLTSEAVTEHQPGQCL